MVDQVYSVEDQEDSEGQEDMADKEDMVDKVDTVAQEDMADKVDMVDTVDWMGTAAKEVSTDRDLMIMVVMAMITKEMDMGSDSMAKLVN